MKTAALFLLLAGCSIALVSLIVHLNSESEFDAPNGFARAVQGEEPKPPQADDVSEKYRETVDKGLEYLVKNQFKDGHWEGDDGKHPVALTGLAGLALVMEGDGPVRRNTVRLSGREPKYLANIRKAVDWLMEKSQAGRDGLIFSGHPSETSRYMQGHGLATLFLTGAYQDEKDDARRKKLTEVLAQAVKYIVKAQSTQGGWYHTSKVEGHDFDAISVTAIQIQALQAAENAGIPVPQETINDAQAYLRTSLEKYDTKAKLGQSGIRQSDVTAALTGINTKHQYYYSRELPKDELREMWVKYCQTQLPVGHDIQFGRDELTHYYYAQALFCVGGDSWKNYRRAMFDHLQSSQNKDGSWPSAAGISDGAVFSTAVWCTIFQLDKRSHPSIRNTKMLVT